MRAAAASLRAFGAGGQRGDDDDGDDGEVAAAAASEAAERCAAAATGCSSAASSSAGRAHLWTRTANDLTDPPLPIPYAAASALQEALAEQLLRGGGGPTAPTPTTTTHHTLLLLQHAPVFTVGKRGHGHGFLTDDHMRAALAAGAQLHADSPRGGQATFHGLGQAVAYPVVCLKALRVGARRYVEALEDSASRACGAWGVEAKGRQPAGRTGVWAGGRKVAAVGVRVSRGVATHGLALNVGAARAGEEKGEEKGEGEGEEGSQSDDDDDDDALLRWFRLIDPCGLGGELLEEEGAVEAEGGGGGGVTTSLWRELGGRRGGGGGGGAGGGWPTVRRVAADVAHALASELGVRAVWPAHAAADADAVGPPLPREAARVVLEALACAPAALSARAPRLV
jgi:lipoate-protein ligase B